MPWLMRVTTVLKHIDLKWVVTIGVTAIATAAVAHYRIGENSVNQDKIASQMQVLSSRQYEDHDRIMAVEASVEVLQTELKNIDNTTMKIWDVVKKSK